jgi:hypothetical protein
MRPDRQAEAFGSGCLEDLGGLHSGRQREPTVRYLERIPSCDKAAGIDHPVAIGSADDRGEDGDDLIAFYGLDIPYGGHQAKAPIDASAGVSGDDLCHPANLSTRSNFGPCRSRRGLGHCRPSDRYLPIA